MKCFVHADVDAVGICCACSRGLCSECAHDLGRGLACRGRCEVEARRIHDLRDFSFTQPQTQKAMIARSDHALRTSALLSIVTGGVMSFLGFTQGPAFFMFQVLGPCMALFGLLQAVRIWRIPRSDQFRLCPHCGYNATGNQTGRCSECGKFL